MWSNIFMLGKFYVMKRVWVYSVMEKYDFCILGIYGKDKKILYAYPG